MAAQIANYAAKKALGQQMDKYKHKKVAGSDDPFFEEVKLPNGKTKKVRKQIPDYIPTHDAQVLEKCKSRAYHLDMSLFNFLGIRFGWSAVIGLLPEIGDFIDLFFAVRLMNKCNTIEGGLPSALRRKMIRWIVIDFLIGLVPFIGDLADAAFRANTMNVSILENHLIEKHGPKSMNIQEKRRSRLEDVSDDRKRTHDEKEGNSIGNLDGPVPVHKSQKSSGGRWYSRDDRQRGYDVEMGGQQNGMATR